MGIQLEPHQLTAINELSNGKVLCGGTGVGKSLTAIGYYLENEAPKPVYVITTALKRDTLDWHKEFVKFGIAEGHSLYGKLVVDSWNNLHKYKEVRDAFFIFDEQRAVGYGSWAKGFIETAKHNRWIMLSATPGDVWMDYVPVFIANGWYKNKTHFVREHVEYEPYVKHPKVKRYHRIARLVRLRNQLLVQMPYERKTTRETYEISVGYDVSTLEKVVKRRWHVYENRPIRNVAELFSVTRKVVNTDESRLAVVRELLGNHPKLIVFYNFDYELEILRDLAQCESSEVFSRQGIDTERSTDSLSALKDGASSESRSNEPWNSLKESPNATIPTALSVAEWNGHRHDPIPKTDRWVYLVQYTAGSEGWNCIETDAMCFYSLTYSWRAFDQAHGRIDRMNTPFEVLHYYILRSESWIDKAIWKALRLKKSFNEAAWAKRNLEE